MSPSLCTFFPYAIPCRSDTSWGRRLGHPELLTVGSLQKGTDGSGKPRQERQTRAARSCARIRGLDTAIKHPLCSVLSPGSSSSRIQLLEPAALPRGNTSRGENAERCPAPRAPQPVPPSSSADPGLSVLGQGPGFGLQLPTRRLLAALKELCGGHGCAAAAGSQAGSFSRCLHPHCSAAAAASPPGPCAQDRALRASFPLLEVRGSRWSQK